MITTAVHADAKPRRKPRKEAPVPVAVLEHASFEFRMVPKSQLLIPVDEYQRDESTGMIAKDIALHFNRVAFGALTVIERRNNGGAPLLLVADGGTRLSASRMRDDLDLLPCLVFSGLTREEEADVFLAINQNRKRLLVEQLQHSEVFAGRPHAIRVDEILQSFKHERVDFNSLAALRGFVKRFPREVETVVKLLNLCAVDKHVGVRVFKGLVYLEHHMQKHARTLFDRARIAKLKDKFGLLESHINAAIAGSAQPRGANPLASARAIATVIGIKFPRGTV